MDAPTERDPGGTDRPCTRHRSADPSTDGHGATDDGFPVDPNRRRLLVLGGGLAVASLAGCTGGGNGSIPDPVSLAGGLQCDQCGMVIEMHPGPNGQVFYPEHSPEGHENPARFDSVKACLFPYKLEHERLDWEATAVYATDYSSVEYALRREGATTYISSHVAAETFARAADLVYVVGSDVEGAMGPDFLPFSEPADAESFVAEHGGEVVEYGDIDEGLIGR